MQASFVAIHRAVLLGFLVSAAAAPASAQSPKQDWRAVDRAIGRPGSMQPGDVQKYSFPRADLHVAVADVEVKPALALGSWVAFKATAAGGGEAMAMGDLVLARRRGRPGHAQAAAGGVEPTALHNHLQRESPAVMYLHIQAPAMR